MCDDLLLRSTLLVVTSLVHGDGDVDGLSRYLTGRLREQVGGAVLTLILQGMAFAPPFTVSRLHHHGCPRIYSSRVRLRKVFFLRPLVIQWKRRHGPAIVARYTRGFLTEISTPS